MVVIQNLGREFGALVQNLFHPRIRINEIPKVIRAAAALRYKEPAVIATERGHAHNKITLF